MTPELDRLRLPVVAAPMFLISGPELVVAAAQAGVVGSFPAPTAARPTSSTPGCARSPRPASQGRPPRHLGAEPGHAPHATPASPRTSRSWPQHRAARRHHRARLAQAGDGDRARLRRHRHRRRRQHRRSPTRPSARASTGWPASRRAPAATPATSRRSRSSRRCASSSTASSPSAAASPTAPASPARSPPAPTWSTWAPASWPRPRAWRRTEYKQMVVDHGPDDLIVSSGVTGTDASWLRPSLVANGYDLDAHDAARPARATTPARPAHTALEGPLGRGPGPADHPRGRAHRHGGRPHGARVPRRRGATGPTGPGGRCGLDSSAGTVMRGWQIDTTGEPAEVMALRDLPEPEPGPGQVAVEVGACALSVPDLHARPRRAPGGDRDPGDPRGRARRPGPGRRCRGRLPGPRPARRRPRGHAARRPGRGRARGGGRPPPGPGRPRRRGRGRDVHRVPDRLVRPAPPRPPARGRVAPGPRRRRRGRLGGDPARRRGRCPA